MGREFCSTCKLFNFYDEDKRDRMPDCIGNDGEPCEVGFCRLKSDAVWRDGLCDRYVAIGEPSVETAFLRARIAELESGLKA